ncbi:hypothetical protein DFQ28_009084 [Apophysomyces sp. BC1034]|nr:hypothetical protein DFQ29_008887 [Apophysomyces sp. BC1021]KAG0173045.1 hypothetical protein DFQ30_009062 [Apophysomyces sp. BC1015]KAG0192473.1 hypothetical protein DFQ28_009084 [Apophysomyces sp. BC1034]
MGLFNIVIEDLGDITKDISTTLFTTEDQETESAELTEEEELPKETKPPSRNIDDIPPEWNRGVLHDREEAREAAFELVNKEDIKKLVRLYGGSDLLCDGRSHIDKDQDSKDESLGVHFNFNFPVAAGFTGGARACCRNKKNTSKSIENSPRSALIAISFGEMSFKNGQIRPTDSFRKAVHGALDIPNANKVKIYNALQKVFEDYGGRVSSTREEITENGGANFGFPGTRRSVDTSKSNPVEATRRAELEKPRMIAHGGDAAVLMTEGFAKWIKTIKANQKVIVRTQLNPMYNLLDEKTKQKVIDIYDSIKHGDHTRYNSAPYTKHVDHGRDAYINTEHRTHDNIEAGLTLPRIPSGWDKGIMYNGEESLEAAFELENQKDLFKLVQTYNGPSLSYDRDSSHEKNTNQRGAAFGTHFAFGCPIARGFEVAAKATYENDNPIPMSDENKTQSAMLSLTYAEMNLKPESIKPTVSFVMAIDEALKLRYWQERLAALQKAQGSCEQKDDNIIEPGAKVEFSSAGLSADISHNLIEVLKSAEQNIRNLNVIGGDSSKVVVDISKWAHTVKDNQRIIFRTDIRPMYDLLDSDRMQAVVLAYELQERIHYGTLYSMVHVKYGRYVCVDEEHRIYNISNAKDNGANRDNVLFAYETVKDKKDSLKMRFKPIQSPNKMPDEFVKYGDEVLLESCTGKDRFIKATSTPLVQPRVLEMPFLSFFASNTSKRRRKRPYTTVSLSEREKINSELEYRWKVIPAEGTRGNEGEYVKRDERIAFKSCLVSPGCGLSSYLSLAKPGTKPNNMIPLYNHKPEGRYLAGKYCNEPIKESLEVSWTLADAE